MTNHSAVCVGGYARIRADISPLGKPGAVLGPIVSVVNPATLKPNQVTFADGEYMPTEWLEPVEAPQ